MANEFWAANVPPSEAIGPSSPSGDRRRFLIAKYREGKYRRYHPLFGNQEELDRVSEAPQSGAGCRFGGFHLGAMWGSPGCLGGARAVPEQDAPCTSPVPTVPPSVKAWGPQEG